MAVTKYWKLVSEVLTISDTAKAIRLTDGQTDKTKPVYTPGVNIQADEANTADVGFVNAEEKQEAGSTTPMDEAGNKLAARGSLDIEGPQILGSNEMIDLSKIWVATDTASNKIVITYLKRVKSDE